mmetsp:Transcript_15468/g.17676  ORF Transcript_15468/g.17676 Transcript_15468/m.17676 type:complete len:230 (-) Transcript_15468:119-808(-)
MRCTPKFILLALTAITSSVISFTPSARTHHQNVATPIQQFSSREGRTTTTPPTGISSRAPSSSLSSSSALSVSFLDETLSSATTFGNSASSFLLSTIDGDIASISDDQFGLVFAGGITVMVGGVASALMVGFLLESNNSYANVVADSYVQGGDEEFWESLSPEDQVKTKELIDKLRKSKEKGNKQEQESLVTSIMDSDMEAKTEKDDLVTSTSNVESRKEVSMFSDYDD